ncbi:DNA-binding transcriptional LysR family regulator [Sinobacterium caligoides]|uniref:DNA-binding transcriptional LysR family regulator n=1 Tax=Sinobacterium caligoides TaxID=933926 RepID=A0A3N2DNY8_9GAMM|nr:LysR family transcriptional regulator [Sinobacterium caligoides]ROS01500.1 DNA-binding transcriptional LysR family regulator [Sinobacterium caligoides]
MKASSIIPKPVAEYDLRLLKVFMAVVENSGFAASEQALGVGRSTISIHMSNLENRLQLKLCSRGRSGFALTDDGQAVYLACKELFNSLNDFSLLVGSLSERLSGEIVILCSDQVISPQMQQHYTQAISYLHQQAPDLHIVFDGDSIDNIERMLLKEKAHIAIYPYYRHIEGLEQQVVYSEKIYLCCGNKHPFFSLTDEQISDKQLASSAAIHPGMDIGTLGKEQLSKLNLAAKSYQFSTRKSMIMSGSYIGYMPGSYIQTEIEQGEIRIIKQDSLSYPFNLYVVNKKNAREHNKVELAKASFIKPLQ